MTQIHPYLTFNGNCADAMHHYERVLRGKLDSLVTHGQAGSPTAKMPGMAERVMHAQLSIDGQTVMASDAFPGQPYQGMHGFSVLISYDTEAQAKRTFEALADGGAVVLPLQSTQFAKAFGMVVDKFGTPWSINGAVSGR